MCASLVPNSFAPFLICEFKSYTQVDTGAINSLGMKAILSWPVTIRHSPWPAFPALIVCKIFWMVSPLCFTGSRSNHCLEPRTNSPASIGGSACETCS